MFERELERARKSLREQLATRAPYQSLRDIQATTGLHPAYRTFFGAEVQWWIHEERALRASNPRFDTSEAAFREVFARLDDAYVRHARFDQEELASTCDAAVKTRLNFLCRPRTTLKWFVFRGEPTKPLSEVLLRLSYFHDHEYLIDGIRAWIEARRADASSSLEILSIVEFERVIEKVDNEAILDVSQDEFVALLDPLYEWFASYNPELPPESVPTESVIIFLDDKGAIPLSQTLERMLYREQLKVLTRTKLFDVIDLVISEIEAGIQQPAFTQTPEAVVVPAEPVPEPEPEPEPEPPTITSHYDVRYGRYSEHVDQATRQRFLQRLFQGEEVEMELVVGDVLGSETWKIAAAKLDRWLLKRGVAPTNAIAMEFTHALNRAFR